MTDILMSMPLRVIIQDLFLGNLCYLYKTCQLLTFLVSLISYL